MNSHGHLSPKEKEVMTKVCLGHTDEGIGTALSTNVNTVHTHVRRVMNGFGFSSRTEAAIYCVLNNLVDMREVEKYYVKRGSD